MGIQSRKQHFEPLTFLGKVGPVGREMEGGRHDQAKFVIVAIKNMALVMQQKASVGRFFFVLYLIIIYC